MNEPNIPPDDFIGVRKQSSSKTFLSKADTISDLCAREQIREFMAGYTRAVDSEDFDAFRNLFARDVVAKAFSRQPDGTLKPVHPPRLSADELALDFHRRPPLKPGACRHHFITNILIEVSGDTARVNAHGLSTLTEPDLELKGKIGAQGTVKPTWTGYYNHKLRKIDGRWVISEFVTISDVSYVLAESGT